MTIFVAAEPELLMPPPAMPRPRWQMLLQHMREQKARPAFRLLWRAIRSPRRSWRWLAAVEDIRLRAGARRVPYALLRKNGQAYLQCTLDHAERTYLFQSHYDLVFAMLGRSFVAHMLHEQPVVLAGLQGKAGAAYEVQLGFNILNRNEGELILELVRVADARRVLSLSLVAGALAPDAVAALWIGGMQGASFADGKDVTVKATRDLWGLRPKDLLLHASYALKDRLGLATIKAISNATHIRHARSRKKIWHADYDGFWDELGGERRADGFYHLPATRTRRPFEEVQPSKRSAWRARYALVDEMTGYIAGRVF